MIDFERQRETMVESQLRPNEVTDTRLLAAMRTVPRELFVPSSRRGFAYMDEALEVFPAIDGAPARFLLAPMVLARLAQLASVEATDRVLDVGCATGYSTAILASFCTSVIGLEPEPELADFARNALKACNLANVEIVETPLARGHEAGAPYDVIFLNGSVPAAPESLLRQLKEGGRLVCMIASGTARTAQARAYRFVMVGGETSGLPHFDAGAHPLPGFTPEPVFSF